MKKISFILAVLCGCASHNSTPPVDTHLDSQKQILAETGGDLRLAYNDLSAWQVGQIFSPITEDYTDRPLAGTKAYKRFDAARAIMRDDLDINARRVGNDIGGLSFAGTFTGETYAEYKADGRSMADYGIAKLTVVSISNMRLDIKLAVNGEFNDIASKSLDFSYPKNGDIKAIEGAYMIDQTLANPTITGTFFVRKQ